MNDLFAIYKRNFPFCVRDDNLVMELLSGDTVHVIPARDPDGKLIGVSVIEENNILMLCVDTARRGQGIGTCLLEASEKHIREQGFASVTVGAGKHYLMPGIPVASPVWPETLQPDAVYDVLDSASATFFRKHGYTHTWDCNCFDMRLDLAEYHAAPLETPGITYRWALPEDMEKAAACTDNAHESFTKYYRNPELYTGHGKQRVFIAECGDLVVGTLIVSFSAEAPGLGSVGCTAVHHDYRGRKIATNLVIRGTGMLKDAGLDKAFLGYTYSGLDKLYGTAGYRICVYYFMAGKTLV